MCCDDDAVTDLPPAVLEMTARYRRMRAQQGVGWGEEAFPEMFRWARFSRLGPAFDEFAASGDWAAAVRAAVGDEVPAGIALVTVAADGGLAARTGRRPVVPGATVPIDVVLSSSADRDVVVTVDGAEVPVPAGGAGLRTVDATAAAIAVTCDDITATLPVTAAPATLRLTSPDGARWSVTDATGGAWFADGVPAKWDADDRPFFHTDPGTTALRVPAGPLHVVAARGPEFERATVDLDPGAGETVTVAYHPNAGSTRRPRAGTAGTCTSTSTTAATTCWTRRRAADAARRGPRRHAAGRRQPRRGTGLRPRTAGGHRGRRPRPGARAGLEFRNDLLGHVHGLGLTGVPALLYTGHEGTDHPWDWPPNSAACAGMRGLLSFARGPAPASNPPGWGRVYAQLGGAALSAPRSPRRCGPARRW